MPPVVGRLLVALLTALAAASAQPGTQAPSAPAVDLAPAGSPAALLQHPEVQTELHLGKDQIEKINRIIQAVRAKHRHDLEELRNLAPAERRRRQAELARTVTDELKRLLTDALEPRQAQRLEQIRRQQEGLRAFTDPEVEKTLRLTAEQKTRLGRIRADAAREARMLFRAAAPGSFEATVKKINAIGRQAVDQAVALLSDEQKKIWRELIGKPFQVQTAPPFIRPPD